MKKIFRSSRTILFVSLLFSQVLFHTTPSNAGFTYATGGAAFVTSALLTAAGGTSLAIHMLPNEKLTDDIRAYTAPASLASFIIGGFTLAETNPPLQLTKLQIQNEKSLGISLQEREIYNENLSLLNSMLEDILAIAPQDDASQEEYTRALSEASELISKELKRLPPEVSLVLKKLTETEVRSHHQQLENAKYSISKL